VSVVRADFHDPEAVLAGPGVQEVVNLAEPVCVILGLILHYVPVARAREVAAGYAQRIAPGSIVIITTPRFDDERVFERIRAADTRRGCTITRMLWWRRCSPAWSSSAPA
jgi:hypothetical protein